MRVPVLSAAALCICAAVLLSGALSGFSEEDMLVGASGGGQLKVDIEFTQPLALPVSVFPGIMGYATGAMGLHSTVLNDTSHDFFELSTAADFRFVLVAKDPGMEVWNDTGSGFMGVGDLFYVGPPPFDTHPIWNLLTASPGGSYSLTLKLRDLNGVYADSDPFVLNFAADPTIAWYQFDGAAGASAGNLPDSGPFGLSGTVVGTASYTAGVSSNCLDLSGDANYGSVANSPHLVLTNSWTVELFFKADVPYSNYGTSGYVLVGKLNSTNSGAYESSYAILLTPLQQIGGLIGFGTNTGIGLYSPTPGANYMDGNWHHAALVYSVDPAGTNDNLSLYADYTLVASATRTNPAIAWTNDPIYIGADNYPGGLDDGEDRDNFDGQVDELRISNLALPPSRFLTAQFGGPAPASIGLIGPGVAVSAASRMNHVYQLQYRNDLGSGSWNNAPGLVPGTGGSIVWTNFFTPGVSRQFFRILQAP